MKIALVQFYSYHEEILAPQIDFLLPDNELFVAAPSGVFEHDYLRPFDSRIQKVVFSDRRYESRRIIDFPGRVLSIVAKYLRLKKIVESYGINLIVFNTITGNFHFVLIALLFRNIDKVHIMHNGQAFLSSKSAERLKIFNKNLFISFDVYNNYIGSMPKADPHLFDWFFPSLSRFIPAYARIPEDLSSDGDGVIIVVPGSVDGQRRNYRGLFEALQSILSSPPQHDCLRIILLGKISPAEQKVIKDMGLDSMIKTYAAYVSGVEMLSSIREADAVAFLVDRSIGENCGLYNKYKATGTSILCLSFGVPCIVSDDFAVDEALKSRAVVYPGTHIETVLRDIVEGNITKRQFGRLREAPLPPEYSYEQSRAHYRNAIGVNG